MQAEGSRGCQREATENRIGPTNFLIIKKNIFLNGPKFFLQLLHTKGVGKKAMRPWELGISDELWTFSVRFSFFALADLGFLTFRLFLWPLGFSID